MRVLKTSVVASALCLCLVWSAAAQAQAVAMAGGAGYKRILTELSAQFTAKTGIAVEQSYGNMGHVTAQAMEGGRLDMVFGDQTFLEGVKGFKADRFIEIGKGRLVMAWAKDAPVANPKDLAKSEVTRVAIPDTKKAIYGKAGLEFLTRSGLLKAVEPKLLMVGTVPQVTAYLVSGEVQAGLLNLTDAMGAAERIGGYVEIDQSQYDPIRIVGALLPGAASKPQVARFVEFLATPEAQAIARKHGL